MGRVSTIGCPGNNGKIGEAKGISAKSGERGAILGLGKMDDVLVSRSLTASVALIISGGIDSALIIALLKTSFFAMTLSSTVRAGCWTLANMVCFAAIEALDRLSPRCSGRGGRDVGLSVSWDFRMYVFALFAKPAFPRVREVSAYFTWSFYNSSKDLIGVSLDSPRYAFVCGCKIEEVSC